MLRRLVLRILLIAVFLNAAVGVPLHAAVHLAAGTGAELPAPTAETGLSGNGEDDDGDHRAGAACAWCLAHAEASSAPPPAPAARPASDRRAPAVPPAIEVVPAFSAGLWSSAPRGPPC